MTPKVLIQVTVFEEDGDVKKAIVRTCNSAYHWEIVSMFEQLGEQVAAIVDPTGG